MGTSVSPCVEAPKAVGTKYLAYMLSQCSYDEDESDATPEASVGWCKLKCVELVLEAPGFGA